MKLFFFRWEFYVVWLNEITDKLPEFTSHSIHQLRLLAIEMFLHKSFDNRQYDFLIGSHLFSRSRIKIKKQQQIHRKLPITDYQRKICDRGCRGSMHEFIFQRKCSFNTETEIKTWNIILTGTEISSNIIMNKYSNLFPLCLFIQ